MADKRIDQLNALDASDLTPDDLLIVMNSGDTSTRKVTFENMTSQVAAGTQGYYALLTNFYFTGGVATETEIALEDTDAWQDVNFTTDALGTFDQRPQIMQDAESAPFNTSTQEFSLEGLSTHANMSFRASMSFEPDEDEGQLSVRLLFTRHTGTVPNDQFPIEDIALTMTQGADIEYPAEPFLSFFVGDTIDTNAPDDAGACKFQIKTTVPGTVRMRALTWYINK